MPHPILSNLGFTKKETIGKQPNDFTAIQHVCQLVHSIGGVFMQLAACRPTQCGDPFHGRSGHLGRELLWLGGPQDAKHGQVGLDRHPFHTSLLAQGLLPGNHSSGYSRGHYYLAHGGGGNTGKWIGHKATFSRVASVCQP